MAKDISIDQLIELMRDGAEIEGESRDLKIEGLDHIASKLDDILDAQKSTAEAYFRLAAAIENLASSTGNPDTSASVKSLIEIIAQNQAQKKPSYEFKIERGMAGTIMGITATPKQTVN